MNNNSLEDVTIEEGSARSEERRDELRIAVLEGVNTWRRAQGLTPIHGSGVQSELVVPRFPVTEVSREAVIQPIPRRTSIYSGHESEKIYIPPIPKRVEYTASYLQALWRVRVWVYAILWFTFGTLNDMIRPNRANTVNTRARRARRIAQQMGGTFVKLAQQAAIRVDLLPYAYYQELSKLLDEVDPMPTEEAIGLIEANLKTEAFPDRTLESAFSHFDPKPLGSGSIATVYQAVLRETGQKVVIKVRRPQIGFQFAADFKILTAMYLALNYLNLLPSYISYDAIGELRRTILEELDFIQEARHTDLFHHDAKESENAREFFAAPRIFFDYCGEDTIVQEFCEGIMLKEIVSIVENKDPKGLALLKELDIDPVKLAYSLQWINFWTVWRFKFFHADPHPGNIIVRPGGLVVMIDFGSTGRLERKRRNALQSVYEFETQGDLEGASNAALALLEPLPPINTNALLKEVKAEFYRASLAFDSAGSEWTERTTAQLWLGFFRVARKFSVPLNPAVVRLIRGTMLYDTLAARLDPEFNLRTVYTSYIADAGQAAREDLKGEFRKRKKGPTDKDFLQIEELIYDGSRLIFQGQRLLDSVAFQFMPTLNGFVRFSQIAIAFITRASLIWITPIIVIMMLDVFAEVPAAVQRPPDPLAIGLITDIIFDPVQAFLFTAEDLIRYEPATDCENERMLELNETISTNPADFEALLKILSAGRCGDDIDTRFSRQSNRCEEGRRSDLEIAFSQVQFSLSILQPNDEIAGWNDALKDVQEWQTYVDLESAINPLPSLLAAHESTYGVSEQIELLNGAIEEMRERSLLDILDWTGIEPAFDCTDSNWYRNLSNFFTLVLGLQTFAIIRREFFSTRS